jgi:hypothetical protein
MKKTILSICLTLFVGFINAKVRSVGTHRDLEKALSHNHMVVALFYAEEKNNKQMRNSYKNLHRMYEGISSYTPYDDADIAFIKLNVARNELADFPALYGINSIPSFVFFLGGKVLLDKNKNAVTLNGFVSRADLQALINTYYGPAINQAIIHKEEKIKQVQQEENESWKLYFYPRDIAVKSYAPFERDME